MFISAIRTILIVVAMAAAATFADTGPPVIAATTFTVNKTTDGPDVAPGNGVCADASADCTLRAAIQEANALAGADVIEFALGGGVPVIAPAVALPAITAELRIDGSSGGATAIEINGAGAGGANGLTGGGPAIRIDDLVIHSFVGNGVAFSSSLVEINNSRFGTNHAGTLDLGNGASGIQVTNAPTVSLIGNRTSANDLRGISITGGVCLNLVTIENNVVGQPALGSLGNATQGIVVGAPSCVAPAGLVMRKNVVSGNGDTGIDLGVGNGWFLDGNRVGVDSGGSFAVPSGGVGDAGIVIGGDDNVIGSTAQRSMVAGFPGDQIFLASAANNNIIRESYIGVDITGNTAIGGLGGSGILVTGSTNTIGGPSVSDGNVISGNGAGGIRIGGGTAGTVVRNNMIGVGADTTTLIGNGAGGFASGAGVFVQGKDNTFLSNSIAGNNGDGIMGNIGSSTGNEVVSNRIWANGKLGINWMGLIGPDPNDVGDADAGPNNLQNYPVVSSAITNGSFTVMKYSLNSTASSFFNIEAFSNSSCDSSGFGEGEVQVAGTTAGTDAGGNTGTQTAFAPAVPVGSFVTMTATNQATNDTSEFSQCVAVAACTDGDCDGFADVAPSAHQGPANTDITRDNCIGSYNPAQLNTADGDLIDLSPPKAFDDRTWPNSDAIGDFCTGDNDSDNDGLDDVDELFGTLCGGVPTNHLARDTDGDLFLDRAECTLGTDPTNFGSAPLSAACGAGTDSDGDKVADRFEFCFYNTKILGSDTDGDGCVDGKEVASINADRSVSSIDLGQVAQHFGAYALPAPVVNAAFDMNKDKSISSSDLGLIAQNFGPC